MNNSDGKELKGDAVVTGIDAAKDTLQAWIKLARAGAELPIEAKSGAKKKAPKKTKGGQLVVERGPEKWHFDLSLLKAMNKSQDDLIVGYLRWAAKVTVPSDSVAASKLEAATLYNVSKAFRRLEAYADWLYDHRDLFRGQRWNTQELRERYSQFGFFVPRHTDAHGRVMWMMDFNRCPAPVMEKDEAVIFFAHTTHLLMLDDATQRGGCIVLQSLNYMGLSAMMKMVPIEAKNDVDKLSQGASCVRMHKFLVLQTPTWMSVVFKIVRMFLSKKMAARISVLGTNWKAANDEVGGAQYVPYGWGKAGGNSEVRDKFFNTPYPFPRQGEGNTMGGKEQEPEDKTEAGREPSAPAETTTFATLKEGDAETLAEAEKLVETLGKGMDLGEDGEPEYE